MKPLSASAAAKAVGKSIPTITRAIKSGKLSAKILEKGGYEIAPSELFRVWDAVTDTLNKNDNMLGYDTPNVTNALQGKVDALLAEKLTRLEQEVADLRSDRDEWREQARSLRLLTDQSTYTSDTSTTARQGASQARTGFFRLWGRSKN